MKNHIAFKFIAIILCAASLLGAVGSGLGIFAMTEQGLYDRTVDEAYDSWVEGYANSLAYDVVHHYASIHLGGANSQLTNSFYGDYWSNYSFDWDRTGYVIKDAEGNVLQDQTLNQSYPAEHVFTFPVGGNYIHVLSETPREEYIQETAPSLEESTTIFDGETTVYNAIPEGGAEVYFIDIQFADGSGEGFVSAEESMGWLIQREDGMVEFLPTRDYGEVEMARFPVSILFQTMDHQCIYEASSPDGVLETARWTQGVGQSFVLRNLEDASMAEEANPTETFPTETIPEETMHAETMPVETMAEETVPERNINGTVKANANIYAATDFNAPVVGFVTTGDTVVIAQQVEENGIQWGWIDGFGWVMLDQILLMPEDTPENVIEIGDLLVDEPSSEFAETIPIETFSLDPIVEETLPDETVEEITVPATTSAVLAYAEDAETYSYYNYTTGQSMMVEYVYEPMPEYTVEVQLASGAMRYEYEWVLLRLVYAYQNYLPVILGICLLVFAIMAVYLCCAAGKKPGSLEIRAAGLNCIPLDLYAVIIGCCVMLLAVGGVEGTRYLLQSSVKIGLLFAALMAFAACLMIVGFCFACAAQFKTPGGYWWRHSVCGWCLRLLGRSWNFLLRFFVWLDSKWDAKLFPGLVKLCKGIFKLLEATLKMLWKWILIAVHLLEKGTDRLGKAINHFFSMLPVTWQWLLVGFVMFLLMAMVYATNGEEVLIVLCIGACIAIIIYGAHCFGTLLEAAKRMSKGDLDGKVDDKLLTGAFKDFAGELNSLADVAVVAAQKQLKSERMKTELITNVSHDIKTPLTSIINYVDLLQKPHTEEEQEVYLEVLDRQSQRLKKLIDDLMEMSKASTGNLAVDIGKVDAVEAVNQALGEFADKLDKAQLIAVFRQPEEQVMMMADGRLVWRVMSNLLSNAVKYALPGTRLYVDLQKVDSKVIISMKNISREELNVNADDLLERFVRGDASRNTEGSGLGLNIAQSLMELQKGQLQILVDGDLFKVTLIFPGV